ncbi:hypothetical protein DL770_007556 [Monosporascus sp. CRB-9-2]|nr:hypothetical protein DL770_007556 [Monosporascus sp. CRB-9-2]
MVINATKQWAGLALLPQPNTRRHMVDELMRRQHPELDMELATTPQQLEERAMCIVHYGTWAQQGHTNPEFVRLTPNTRLIMGGTERRSRAELLEEVLPHLKVGVLGLSSEVARFLVRHLAPKGVSGLSRNFPAPAKAEEDGRAPAELGDPVCAWDQLVYSEAQ